jgi:hypothetical protein
MDVQPKNVGSVVIRANTPRHASKCNTASLFGKSCICRTAVSKGSKNRIAEILMKMSVPVCALRGKCICES